MAKQSKIEKYGLQDKIIKLKNNGKSLNDIVNIVKEKDNIKLSVMAVKRWLDKQDQIINEKAVEVIKEDKRRVVKSINQTYDIIQTQLDVSQRVLDKLNNIENISETVSNVCDTAIQMMKSMGVKISPEEFAYNIEKRISKNINDYTKLTKEIRENNKFLSELKEKIYDFQLVQEFINIFKEEFRKENPEAYERVIKRLAANPRMQWLAREQSRRSE